MEIGETLKAIRKNKGMTLKEAAGETISISHLSRVEKGENKCSTNEFFQLLENLNTSIEEFEFLRGNEREEAQQKILHEIVLATNKKDISKLQEIEQALRSKSYAPYSFEQFMLYGIENIYLGLEKKPFKGGPFLDYLIQVDNWGKLECTIFSNFLITFDPETTYHLMHTAIKRSKLYSTIPGNHFMLHKLLLNLFSSFLLQDEIHYAEEILAIQEVTSAPMNDSIHSKMEWDFNKGVLEFKKGNKDKGVSIWKDVIDLCQRLGKDSLAKEFEERLHSWLHPTNPKEEKNQTEETTIILDVEWQ